MTPKLLNDGYRPSPTPRGNREMIDRGYQPAAGARPTPLPPPPPPNTGSSVVKPKD